MYVAWKYGEDDAHFYDKHDYGDFHIPLDTAFKMDVNLRDIIIHEINSQETLATLLYIDERSFPRNLLFDGPDPEDSPVLRRIYRFADVTDKLTGKIKASMTETDNILALLGTREINAVKIMLDTFQQGLAGAVISEIMFILTKRPTSRTRLSFADIIVRLKYSADVIEKVRRIGPPKPNFEMEVTMDEKVGDHPIFGLFEPESIKQLQITYRPGLYPAYRRITGWSGKFIFEFYGSVPEQHLVLTRIGIAYETDQMIDPREMTNLNFHLAKVTTRAWARLASLRPLRHLMFANGLSPEAVQLLRARLGTSIAKTFKKTDPASAKLFAQFTAIPREGGVYIGFRTLPDYGRGHWAGSSIEAINFMNFDFGEDDPSSPAPPDKVDRLSGLPDKEDLSQLYILVQLEPHWNTPQMRELQAAKQPSYNYDDGDNGRPARQLDVPVKIPDEIVVNHCLEGGAAVIARSNMCMILARDESDSSSISVDTEGRPKRGKLILDSYNIVEDQRTQSTTPNAHPVFTLYHAIKSTPDIWDVYKRVWPQGSSRSPFPLESLLSVLDTIGQIDVDFSEIKVRSRKGPETKLSYMYHKGSHIYLSQIPRTKEAGLAGEDLTKSIYRVLAPDQNGAESRVRRGEPVLISLINLSPTTQSHLLAIRKTYRDYVSKGGFLYISNIMKVNRASQAAKVLYGFENTWNSMRAPVLRAARLWFLLLGLPEIYAVAASSSEFCSEVDTTKDSVRQVNAILIWYQYSISANTVVPQVLIVFTNATSYDQWANVAGDKTQYENIKSLVFNDEYASNSWFLGEAGTLFALVASQSPRLPQRWYDGRIGSLGLYVKKMQAVELSRKLPGRGSSAWDPTQSGTSTYQRVEATLKRDGKPDAQLSISVSDTGDHLIVENQLPPDMQIMHQIRCIFSAWSHVSGRAVLPLPGFTSADRPKPQMHFFTFHKPEVPGYLLRTAEKLGMPLNKKGAVLAAKFPPIAVGGINKERALVAANNILAGSPSVQVLLAMLRQYGGDIAQLTGVSAGLRLSEIWLECQECQDVDSSEWVLHVKFEPGFRPDFPLPSL
ncbi:hypothetical protein ABW21_db0204170 [Orbilia brochopaga]|nr:hypothetical protein ABW21_db0204170 [Drechslerella brochopaga]